MESPDPRIDLLEASLVIALEEYPALQIDSYMSQIDRWGEEIRERLEGSSDVERFLEQINRLLFEEEGFHGEAGDYYDPKNAFLNEVLDRHAGLPLALSIVYIEIFRRVGRGMDVAGVALPGRFLVKIRGVWGELLIDPFDEGRVLTERECQAIMDQVFGGAVQLREQHLRSSSQKEVVTRLLAHLKSVYMARDDLQGAITAIDRILILDEHDAWEIHDRAMLEMQLHRYREAMEDLEHYLELMPHAEDRPKIRGQIDYLRGWLDRN